MEQNTSLPFLLKEQGKTIKVIIADDQSMFLDGLRMMLAGYPTITILGEAANGEEVMSLVVQEKPDVIITDIQMPQMDGIELTKELLKHYPEIKIIALTGFGDDHYVVDMFEAGARGYLTKNSKKEKLVEAIYAVLGNGNYFCERTEMSLIRKLAQSQAKIAITEDVSILTPKEREVVQLICEELSNKEIADRLHVLTHSVENYRYNIYEKLGVKNSVGVAFFAVKSGLYKL